jgi:hypothetical protein
LIENIYDPNSKLYDVQFYQDAQRSNFAQHPTNAISNVVGGVGSFFSKIGLQARQRPDRRNHIMLFIVGEITWTEVREVQAVIDRVSIDIPNTKIVIGACKIANSSHFLKRFCSRIWENL